MAKTKPIGVRFDEEILKEIGGTPQSVLISLEGLYKAQKSVTKKLLGSDTPVFKNENVGFLIPTNNAAGNPVTVTITEKDHVKPKRHKLWKEGDPEEGTNAFYMRKGAYTYDEIEK